MPLIHLQRIGKGLRPGRIVGAIQKQPAAVSR